MRCWAHIYEKGRVSIGQNPQFPNGDIEVNFSQGVGTNPRIRYAQSWLNSLLFRLDTIISVQIGTWVSAGTIRRSSGIAHLI